MTSKHVSLAVIIVLLLAGNAFFIYRNNALIQELATAKEALTQQRSAQTNNKVLAFTQMFITNVLKADQEVDFETRLKLETAVRDLGDPQIREQWDRFVNSKTETQAQQEVENLLELLVNKIGQ